MKMSEPTVFGEGKQKTRFSASLVIYAEGVT